MKNGFAIAVSVTLCAISGVAVAKNLNANSEMIVTAGTAQTVAVSSVAIAQSIEGQYSGSVAIGLGANRAAIVGSGPNGGNHAIVGSGPTGGNHAIVGSGPNGGNHAIVGSGPNGGNHAIVGSGPN